MAGKATFIPPDIQDNPEGWGPCQIPKMFQDIPYQPFSKADRLGKVSDWTGGTYQDRRYNNKYNSQFGAGAQMFSYFHEQDESSFHLVDTTKAQKPAYLRNRAKFNQRNMRRDRERREQRLNANLQPLGKNKAGQRIQRKLQKQYGNRGHWQDRRQQQAKHRNASVMVREEWKVVEEMDFPRLSKLSLPNIGEPSILKQCGELRCYDKSYDRITTKSEKPLIGVNRTFHRVTTTDDPEIRKLLSEGNVFGTDAIISTLMTCTRSVYSWDIVVQRVGKKLFFDKRDDSEFDLLSVNETANDALPEEGAGINSPTNLAVEATYVNQNFSQQVLKSGDKHNFPNPNPFLTEDDEGEVASVGYKYQKFDLGDDISLILRCEHDAVMPGANGEKSFINIKTLNEWDPYVSKTAKASNVEWRQKLDSQRGAILATELKNNSCKLAKWTASAILAGSEYLKLGFVSRKNYWDSTSHVILGTSQFRPKEFATQIALNIDNAWGILRCIIDTCMKLPEGKYLILKDPNKTVVRIYDIPENTFESSDEDDDEDDEEEKADDEAEER